MWAGASADDGGGMYPGHDLDPAFLTAYHREQIDRSWRRERVIAAAHRRTHRRADARRRTLLRLTTGRLPG